MKKALWCDGLLLLMMALFGVTAAEPRIATALSRSHPFVLHIGGPGDLVGEKRSNADGSMTVELSSIMRKLKIQVHHFVFF